MRIVKWYQDLYFSFIAYLGPIISYKWMDSNTPFERYLRERVKLVKKTIKFI